MSFGQVVKELRVADDRSATWLSERSGVSVGTVILVESSPSHDPKLSTCEALAFALGLELVLYDSRQSEVIRFKDKSNG